MADSVEQSTKSSCQSVTTQSSAGTVIDEQIAKDGSWTTWLKDFENMVKAVDDTASEPLKRLHTLMTDSTEDARQIFLTIRSKPGQLARLIDFKCLNSNYNEITGGKNIIGPSSDEKLAPSRQYLGGQGVIEVGEGRRFRTYYNGRYSEASEVKTYITLTLEAEAE